MINWILQKNLTKPEDLTRIKNSLNGTDESWQEIEIIPFSNNLPEIENKNSQNVIYGSTTFMINAFKDKNYKNGVFYDPETFQMKNYVNKWGEHVLNYNGQLIYFGEINKIESHQSKEWFVRPNHDSKEFSGRVDTFEELVKWSNKICKLELSDFNYQTEIWISEPQEIIKEWRLFIVDKQIISSSRYMVHGELNESEIDNPKEMIDFVENRIKEYNLDNIFVMDIAQVDQKFKLIECNCFNGTGFYKHDIEKIVTEINYFLRKNINKK